MYFGYRGRKTGREATWTARANRATKMAERRIALRRERMWTVAGEVVEKIGESGLVHDCMAVIVSATSVHNQLESYLATCIHRSLTFEDVFLGT